MATPDERGRWRGLPRWIRIAVIAFVVIVVVVVLFTVVFPRVERYIEDPTLGAPVTSVGRG